jgi:YidC/Oxa1 family membrane protein insertase
MPWVLMFVMAPFAAGLQLYWTVSNILTIAQQKCSTAAIRALTRRLRQSERRSRSADPDEVSRKLFSGKIAF